MRLIDAEALEKLLTDMATDAKSIRELQLNALCFAAVKSESMTPTIEAVPIKTLAVFLGGYAVAPGLVGRFEQEDNRLAWEHFLRNTDWSDDDADEG